MIILILSMLFTAGILHAVGFYFGRTGSRSKDKRRTGMALLLSGIGYVIMGFLGCICCRYLQDAHLLSETKWCSYGLIVFGVILSRVGVWLRSRANRSEPGNKS